MKQLLLSIHKENKLILYITLFFATMSAGADIAGGLVQKSILDNLVQIDSFKVIGFLLILLFITYGINQIFGALTYHFSYKINQKLEKDYKKKALDKFNRIKYSIILDKKEGEINSIISKGSASIGSIIENFLAHIIQNSLMIIFGLVVLLYIDKYIFLYFVFIFIPIFLLYSIKQIKKRIPIKKDINNKDNKVSGEVVEYLTNIRDIKIFGVEGKFINNFFEKFLDIFSLNIMMSGRQHYMNFIQFIILTGSMCLVLFYTGYNIIEGALSIGTFILVYHIFGTIKFALWDMVFLYNRFEEDFINVHKFLDFLELDEQSQKIDILDGDFKILQINNLTFGYDQNNIILKNINFVLKKGEKISIVGKSGEGKTTFISLILGLFDGYSGDISFNSKKVEGKMENIFSYVPQDTKMFNETIRFNLTLGEYFRDDILLDILEKVGLAYLSSRSRGVENILDIQVGTHGLKLSGGERQRLGIARAMIREKHIYIFDEITSNLDEQTEKEILDLIFDIAKHKTFIIITHKKEVLKKVDSIYEMKKGTLSCIN